MKIPLRSPWEWNPDCQKLGRFSAANNNNNNNNKKRRPLFRSFFFFFGGGGVFKVKNWLFQTKGFSSNRPKIGVNSINLGSYT